MPAQSELMMHVSPEWAEWWMVRLKEPEMKSTVLVASYPSTVISIVLMMLSDQQYSSDNWNDFDRDSADEKIEKFSRRETLYYKIVCVIYQLMSWGTGGVPTYEPSTHQDMMSLSD